jgi:hypothetical protein
VEHGRELELVALGSGQFGGLRWHCTEHCTTNIVLLVRYPSNFESSSPEGAHMSESEAVQQEKEEPRPDPALQAYRRALRAAAAAEAGYILSVRGG